MADVQDILKKYWGYDEFRPLQKDIIQSVLAGKDTLAILPTGGGKSICFQVPALAQKGICIVISPLIALMKDQVENLKKRDIPALLIHSGMKRIDVVQTLKNATHDYFKFLYVSPERLETSLFKEYLPGLDVNLIAVDEAHCISQWGYDFRPSYLRIAELRKELPDVPVLALTASATPEVQKDICDKLTSPLTPLRQSRRGESSGAPFPRYSVTDVTQFEYARNNRKQSTEAEKRLWEVLRDKKTGYKFRRQHPIENFIVDFVCIEKRLIVEVDGGYHTIQDQNEYDVYRSMMLFQKGFKVLRFNNEEVLENRYDIKNRIKDFIVSQDTSNIESASPLYTSGGEGLGVRWSVFQQSFERKNLSYSVFKVDSKLAKLVDIVTKVSGTAIVYCKSRKRTNEIMNLLQMHGISSTNYHAGLKPEERNQRQKDWIDNKVRVIVCTNAFGMGIDKPDVRLVVHIDVPDCLENYYQEAGRAGRDGKKSYAVLLYDERDLEELKGLHAIRFPSLEQIKNVYNALTNFLQIPAYTGEYKSFNFRFDEFIRNFKLNSAEALYALKALESDGWLEFNEKSFTPSTLVFTTSKRELAEFEKHYPQHEALLTTLLRSYEGVFDFPAFISENLIARLLKKDEIDIKRQLQTIASFSIVSYTPQNEEPQIVFKKNRVPVDDLMIDLTSYNKRKESFINRVQTMIGYTKENNCRSRYISNYFGDENAKDCDICDNCLRKKATTLSPEEFEKISGIISNHLSQKQLTASELIDEIKNIKKEKAWKVIEYLQSENKIQADDKGLLRLK
jgi:superfamily II DNA helicase RecQ/very-short-patch-repair endonuclease